MEKFQGFVGGGSYYELTHMSWKKKQKELLAYITCSGWPHSHSYVILPILFDILFTKCLRHMSLPWGLTINRNVYLSIMTSDLTFFPKLIFL